MRFAQAHQVFADSNNAKAMSVCLNNIGQLHLRSYCYALAVDSFTQSKTQIKALSDSELPPRHKAFSLAHRSLSLGLALLGKGHVQEQINLSMSVVSDINTRSDFASARSQFIRAIRYFEYIGGFSDYLIYTRILISSAHLLESSALRAQNQLFEAQKLLGDLEKEFPIQRLSLPPIPTCILRQRVELQRAKIFVTMGNLTDAIGALADQMNAGPIFDSNLRYQALITLTELLRSRQIPIPSTVQYLLGRFELRGKDFVFLLNYSASMKRNDNLRRARQALKDIFSSLLGPRDRVALLTFGKNVYRVFSLVEKTQNTRQLQNQLDGLRAPHGPHACLLRGLQEALLQLKENGRHDHKAWIVLLTDTEDRSPPNKSTPKLTDIAHALQRFEASAFVLAFSQNPGEQLIQLAASTPESILLSDPGFPQIATGFEAVSPIHRPSPSLLLEKLQNY